MSTQTRCAATIGEATGQVGAILEEHYDLGPGLEWRRTEEGGSNMSFFVETAAGEYVLRLSNPRKAEDGLRFEVSLVTYLRQWGYPAPRVVPTVSGRPYAEAGGVLCLLTERIPGHCFDHDSRAQLRAAGRALGHYHRLVKDFDRRYRPRPFAVVALATQGAASVSELDKLIGVALGPSERRRRRPTLSRLSAEFRRVGGLFSGLTPTLCHLVIHGSFGPSALLYEGDRVVGVVDYDRAAYEPRALDLANAVRAFAWNKDRTSPDCRIGLDLDRCSDFLHGYQEVEPLPPEEVECLPLVFRGQRLIRIFGRIERLPRQAEAVGRLAALAEVEVRRLRWLEDNAKQLMAAATSGG